MSEVPLFRSGKVSGQPTSGGVCHRVIPRVFLRNRGRSWSHFVGIYRKGRFFSQKTTLDRRAWCGSDLISVLHDADCARPPKTFSIVVLVLRPNCVYHTSHTVDRNLVFKRQLTQRNLNSSTFLVQIWKHRPPISGGPERSVVHRVVR